MSIIQQIREKAAWLVFSIIGLSLLGFLLMDAKPGQGGLFGGNSTTVGVIDGKNIDLAVYQDKIKQVEDQYAAQGYPMNDMMRQNIEEQVWNQFIQEQVMEEEVEKLGLEVTPKEVDDILFVNPSPELKQSLSNPQTGEYDPNQLKLQIAEIKKRKDKAVQKQFNDYIMALAKQRLMEKYNALLGNSAYIPKWMMEKMNADNASVSSISYVTVPYSTIPDSTVKVTDSDIMAYVNDHKDEFKQEVSRSIYYVSFDASPSAKDSADIYHQLESLKTEFAAAPDAAGFLIRNGSETPYHDGYILKSKMMVPHADSIQMLAPGAVFGPYLDGNRYTLAKMVGQRRMPDSVKCRHILIGTVNPQTGEPLMPDSTGKRIIDSIATAIKGGASFDALASQYSSDPGSKDNGGVYEFSSTQFPNLAREFAETVFYGNTGDKKVVKTSFGYHYIEVLSQKGFEQAYMVAYLSKPILPSNETDNRASGLANQFAGQSRTPKAFDENAAKNNYNKLVATDIKPGDKIIPGLGSSRAFVRWIYEAEKGEVSEPYPVEDKYVVAMVSEINKEGIMSAAKARPMVEYILLNEKKGEQIVKKLGTPSSLEQAATANGATVQRADSIHFSNGIIPNVGMEPKVVGLSFNKQLLNKVSRPIPGNGGVFVIKPEVVSAVSSAGADVDQQRSALLAQMKQSAGFRSLDVLRKAADVKDNRSKFF